MKGKSDSLSDIEFRNKIVNYKFSQEIKLLFLNSCLSRNIAEECLNHPSKVENSIGSNDSINDTEARYYALDFYEKCFINKEDIELTYIDVEKEWSISINQNKQDHSECMMLFPLLSR